MGMTILDELAWRGLIAQSTDRDLFTEQLNHGPLTLYAGFDPTAPSLHAGHLIPLLTLRRFQQAGHKPIVLAGGATGLIGDPRETNERAMHTPDIVAEWSERIRHQLSQFIDLDPGICGGIITNNLEWTQSLSAIDFLRNIGKHFSVNVMLDRETIRRRLEGEGISFTEFSYMLLQANDYVELHRRYGCNLQIGGSDQWGNIIAGVRLVRQKCNATVHALTLPLVTSSTGQKFGKSTGGANLWLDPHLTSPYALYQYFINTDDADVMRYLRWFTFLSKQELDSFEEVTQHQPQKRIAQRKLAEELTTLVHGSQATQAVQQASLALFGSGNLCDLDVVTLTSALQETDFVELTPTQPRTLVDLLVLTGLASSRGQARRTIAEKAVWVNNQRIDTPEWEAQPQDFLHHQWLVIRRGRRHIVGVKQIHS